MKKIKKSWLSVHIYYTQHELILREALYPLIKLMQEQRIIDSYFFIRFWKHGPHIRLRLKGKTETLQNDVSPLLINYFQKYFDTNPSQRLGSEGPNQSKNWCPNNSVQFIEYEPETERYGGFKALSVSEQLFELSSETILKTISESKKWDYQTALGVALQMHLSLIRSANMSIREAILFFSYVSDIWIYSAINYEIENSTSNFTQRKTDVLKKYVGRFQTQKIQLIQIFKDLWTGLDRDIEFEQYWMNNWIDQLESINENLLEALKIEMKLGIHSLCIKDKHKIWSIYESHIHMSNNRLGILNKDESYLGFLLKEGLDNI